MDPQLNQIKISVVYIELGGNMGITRQIFHAASELIEQLLGEIYYQSSLYKTAPWGFDAQQPFLNRVLAISTKLDPEEFLKICLSIESQLGRIRGTDGYISRTIDIDILLWKDQIIDKPDLKIPHPLMANRRFVLEPLCEIAPNLIHPITNKTICKMLEECGDKLECTKLTF